MPKPTHEHLSPCGRYYFDVAAADRICNFLERYCRHIEGELQGERVQLTDFWRETLREIFGWKKVADGFRRYRYVYIEIPKKNAKSFIMSGVGLYMTCADGEKGAKVFALAGDKDQARIIFNASKQMVEADKQLSKILFVLKDSISHKKSASIFKVLSADAKTKHGPNVHAAIFDEMHVQPNSELYDTVSKGTANRRQPLVMMVTTAGYKNTFAHRISVDCRNIYEGRVKSDFWFVRMFGTTEERAMAEWDSPALHAEVNPGYGITVQAEYFDAEVEAIRRNPANLSAFLRLHLNVWTGSERMWEIIPHWHKCDFGRPNIEALAGRECFTGIDLAPRGDTSAMVHLFPPKEEGERWEMVMRCYIPADTLTQRKQQENDQWDAWTAQGLATATPGNITDYDAIMADLKADGKRYSIQHIGCDAWSASQFIASLQEAGLPVVEYPQTLKGMSPPMLFFEERIMAGLFNHGGHPILAWMAGNVVIKEDFNKNRMPDKGKSKARIDGIAALLTAMGIYLSNQAPQQRSIYEDTEMWVDE